MAKDIKNESEIFDAAIALGNLIGESELIARYHAAKEEYENDEALSALITEFNVQQSALSVELTKTERDDAVVAALNEKLNELYEKVTENDKYAAFEAVNSELASFMNRINSVISQIATGESGCSGNCASCGGCG